MAKLVLLGVFHTHGVSKKTGAPYQISKVTYGREISPVKNEQRSVEGYGYEAQDMDLDPSALHAFREIKFPAVVDCKIECQPQNPQRNWITGLA
jgi:hypothetical protein